MCEIILHYLYKYFSTICSQKRFAIARFILLKSDLFIVFKTNCVWPGGRQGEIIRLTEQLTSAMNRGDFEAFSWAYFFHLIFKYIYIYIFFFKYEYYIYNMTRNVTSSKGNKKVYFFSLTWVAQSVWCLARNLKVVHLSHARVQCRI